MSIHSIKESFEEVPTKATDALDAQVAYYKLFLFRFIAQSSTGLITFFIVAFACLLMLFFISIAAAYAVGEAVHSVGLCYCRDFLYSSGCGSFLLPQGTYCETFAKETVGNLL